MALRACDARLKSFLLSQRNGISILSMHLLVKAML